MVKRSFINFNCSRAQGLAISFGGFFSQSQSAWIRGTPQVIAPPLRPTWFHSRNCSLVSPARGPPFGNRRISVHQTSANPLQKKNIKSLLKPKVSAIGVAENEGIGSPSTACPLMILRSQLLSVESRIWQLIPASESIPVKEVWISTCCAYRADLLNNQVWLDE